MSCGASLRPPEVPIGIAASRDEAQLARCLIENPVGGFVEETEDNAIEAGEVIGGFA